MDEGKFIMRWWWLMSAPLAALVSVIGHRAERTVIVLALTAAIAAVISRSRRSLLTHGSAILLLTGGVSLLIHLVRDDFDYHYVWLYSAEPLPWHLKLASLWSGDEGTLLLLATLMALAATRLIRYRGWAGPGALVITAGFAAGAAIWNPFTPTPTAALLQAPSQGMNAHLLSIWMSVHPPLIFIAYTFILAPTGAALEALATGRGDWPTIVNRYSRTGWLILSTGLATGMIWAYEDYTFGQFWHWDPVQTSVFLVWALVSAHLHGLRIYRPDGFMARLLPGLSVLAAVGVLVSMLVTRNETLASSHRFVGFTSFPLLAMMAAGLVLAMVIAWVYSLRRKSQRRPQSESVLMIRVAVLLFTVAAAIAAAHLVQAYLSALLQLPRPGSLQPFFETLARWTDPAELAELRSVFAQWEPDNFAINQWLAPLGVLLGLFGGHSFLRLGNRLWGWSITGSIAVIALATAFFIQPLDTLYAGTGMTSQRTVSIFFWLDAMLVTAAYLGVTALLWPLRLARRVPVRTVLTYFAPIGLIHLGVMVALLGALSAAVLDSYAQKIMSYPKDFGQVQRFADGYSLRFDLEQTGTISDGGYSTRGLEGFQAVAEVTLYIEHDGILLETGRGNTLYRDERALTSASQGPVRQMCEILDYRYARYAGGPSYMLHPFIHRGFWRDVQIWLPALNEVVASDALVRPAELAVVIKTYPLISWLWLGLTVSLLGAAVLTFSQILSPSPPAPVTNGRGEY